MCYNNRNVRVTVNSRGSDWSDSKSSDGVLTLTPSGCKIVYYIDGDECVLSVDGGCVTQERCGEQNVRINFELGKRTQCVIGSGGLAGGYDIFTRRLETLSGKGGFRVELEYANGSDEEIINLTLSAVYK